MPTGSQSSRAEPTPTSTRTTPSSSTAPASTWTLMCCWVKGTPRSCFSTSSITVQRANRPWTCCCLFLCLSSSASGRRVEGRRRRDVAVRLVRSCLCQQLSILSIGGPGAASKIFDLPDAKLAHPTVRCPVGPFLSWASSEDSSLDDDVPNGSGGRNDSYLVSNDGDDRLKERLPSPVGRTRCTSTDATLTTPPIPCKACRISFAQATADRASAGCRRQLLLNIRPSTRHRLFRRKPSVKVSLTTRVPF